MKKLDIICRNEWQASDGRGVMRKVRVRMRVGMRGQIRNEIECWGSILVANM